MKTVSILNQPEKESVMLTIAPPVEKQVDAAALPTLIEDFLKAKQRQIAASSVEGYRLDLAPFLAWWDARGDPILTDDSFIEMTKWIEGNYRNGFGQPASPQMIWRTTKRVRQLLTWAHSKNYVAVSLVDMCPLYPDPGRDKYFPDADDITAMLASCTGDTRIRDVALILFATATGARRFEIAATEVEHIEFDTPMTNLDASETHTGFVHLRTVKRDTKGKMRPRWSMFDSSTGLMLKAYIRTFDVRGSLFGLTDSGIQLMVRRVAHDAHLPRAHPHAFRAALIDYWREVNATSGPMADIALKLQVGHSLNSNTDVTMVYQNFQDWRRNRERIRTHYRSPVEQVPIDWQRYPVHIG